MNTDDLVCAVRARLVDLGREATTPAVTDAVRSELAPQMPPDADVRRLVDRVRAELVGAGPLQPLLRDTATTDIVVNGPAEVWVDKGRGLERTTVSFQSATAVRRLAQRLANACGRRLDDAQPWVDARLPDGTRFHAVLPPVAVRGPYLSLRTFRPAGFSLPELADAGTISPPLAELLGLIVTARLSFLISGGTGTGKTTLLASLLGVVPARERIVVVEDAVELRPAHPHVISLEGRPPNVEGAGEVRLRDLVRQALRMRPDRLIVGECRGAEVVELLSALNTGHQGGAGTVHANSVADVPARLEALGALGGLSRDALHSQLGPALQCIVHLGRVRGRRVVETIGVPVTAKSGRIEVLPAWSADGRRLAGADLLDGVIRSARTHGDQG
jgi:pilus assembly protein CpaF